MNKHLPNQKDVARDNSNRDNKPERGEDDVAADTGLLTNTAGSPRVPTPAEMASPQADGKDNRIDLNQQQSQGNQTASPKKNKPD